VSPREFSRIFHLAFAANPDSLAGRPEWMRVDKSTGAPPLAFDNMQDRPITGTADWKSYAVVLDIPEGATGIFLWSTGRGVFG